MTTLYLSDNLDRTFQFQIYCVIKGGIYFKTPLYSKFEEVRTPDLETIIP